jgi:hypothetical protein
MPGLSTARMAVLTTPGLAGARPSVGRLIEVQALFGDNF